MRTSAKIFISCILFMTAGLAAYGQQPKPLVVGEPVPDFKLKTFGDKDVQLSKRFGENGHPVILLFSRANW